jgi:demethylspheroidene O-methyltransferase
MVQQETDGSWLQRWHTLRDRLLASPRFQHWAAAFPLTRPIARRHARALFDLVAGFVYSQVLLACVQLKLFEILAEGPQTIPVLSDRLSLSPDATLRLLTAAVSLRLVAHRGSGRYGLGELGAALVGNPGVAAMVEHHTLLYADLHDPVALLRGQLESPQLARYWGYAGADRPTTLSEEQVAAYTNLMSASQHLVAAEILDAYPLARHRCLLDVGGGEGTFLSSAAARAPQLQLILFDLPAVAERARARFAAAGLAQRATAVGGDFSVDALPQGADIVSLVRVAHDHDDERVLTILRAIRRALPQEGTLLLAEPMSGVAGAEPMGDAYFGFYLLAMGRGRARTVVELAQLLHRAGFGPPQVIPTRMPLQTSLLVVHPA